MSSEVAEKVNAKEALLSAAERLFTAKGYAAVSTRELAEEAGVNLGAIQYHFGSKGQLFVETIRQVMKRRNEDRPIFKGELRPQSPEDAAIQLCVFIYSFLDDICNPEGPDVCRLMFRESMGATSEDPEMFEALISSVVDEFIAPLDEMLSALIASVNSSLSGSDVKLVVQSVIGQCSFYYTHKPFLNRLRGSDYSSKKMLDEAARHVSFFTLRGIGLSESNIKSALSGARKVRAK